MPAKFDHRTFIRLDHGMPENRKVMGLTDTAFRLYVEAICWCSRQESDGHIPEAFMARMGKAKNVTELVDSGLLDTAVGGYQVHDYLDFQRSSEEIGAYRSAKGEAGSRGNHMRWHVARRRIEADCEHCQKGEGRAAS